MIKIAKIKIEEFRGVRDLTIEANGKSFAVCGPNGTGKSGIVDALEFGLTGNISRLSGTGRGDLSVKAHAPHVDSRDNPAKAIVTITLQIPSLNKTAVIERSVKDPKNPKITPNEPEILKVFEEVARHAELVLSRREIINYIISEPGKRSQEIQALLKLEQVEKVRGVLQKIANAYDKEAKSLQLIHTQAAQNLEKALGVGRINDKEILDSVNQRRTLLKLTPIGTLTDATSLKDGLSAAASSGQNFRLPKSQLISEVASLKKMIEVLSSVEMKALFEKIQQESLALASDPIASENATKESFLKKAISFIDQELCPVCDTPWDVVELKGIVNKKLEKFEAVSKQRAAIEVDIEPIVRSLNILKNSLGDILRYNLLTATSKEAQNLSGYKSTIETVTTKLNAFLPIPDTVAALEVLKTPASLNDAIEALEAVVNAIPEPTSQDAAKEFLILAQEKLETYRTSRFNAKKAQELAQISLKTSMAYVETSNAVLDGIYKKVQKEFSELYEFVNQDDEIGFSAKLLPSAGKLGFDVDFYGKGYFPPGAYHSEGHQDVMGLCLYLALMRHILGVNFTLSILDDVVMSVDAGHRRQVCALLKKYFPDTQFILTTHDHVWLKHMITEGLVAENAFIRFREWNVADGPTKWDQRNVWEEIEKHLENNDVGSAASLLRRSLEYIFGEICHRLRAPVEYRGDAQFQYGDLVPSGIGRLKDLLEMGKQAAISWTQADKVATISQEQESLKEALRKTNYEQWEMNAAIHFNEWANFSKEDFAPVAVVFQELVSHFNCPRCNSYLQVVPERGEKQALKCFCGDININLAKKKAAMG